MHNQYSTYIKFFNVKLVSKFRSNSLNELYIDNCSIVLLIE